MNKRLSERFEAIIAILGKATWAVSILLAVAVISLFLWSAWGRKAELLNSILVTLFCLSFGWVFVSMARLSRTLSKLGLEGQAGLRLFSGPRPDDSDELRAWQLGWHFMFAALAVILCMIAIPLAWWLTGK